MIKVHNLKFLFRLVLNFLYKKMEKNEISTNEERNTNQINNVCVKHVSLKDFILFKEEFLQTLGEFKKEMNENFYNEQKNNNLFQNKISNLISIQNDNNINSFLSKINFIEEKNEIISYIKKVEKTINNQIMINNLNLSTCKKDLSEACFKYDKIVADNLLIPGIIGTSCQFPNLREFLLNKKEEISNNIFETKKNSREIKENKNKMDGLFEQLKFQIITIRNNFQTLIDIKMDEIKEKFENFIKVVNDRVGTLNIKNNEYVINLKTQEDKMIKEVKFIENIKQEIFENNSNTINLISNNNKNILSHLNQKKNEFKSMEKNILELSMLLSKKENSRENKNTKIKETIINNFNKMMIDLIKENFINEKKNEFDNNFYNFNMLNNNLPNSKLINLNNNNSNETINDNQINQNLNMKTISEDKESNEDSIKKKIKIKLNTNEKNIKIKSKISNNININIKNELKKENPLNEEEKPLIIDEKKSENDLIKINSLNNNEQKQNILIIENKSKNNNLEEVKSINYEIKSIIKNNKKDNQNENINKDKSENKEEENNKEIIDKNKIIKIENFEIKKEEKISLLDENQNKYINKSFDKNKRNGYNNKLNIISQQIENNNNNDIINEKEKNNINYFKTYSNLNSISIENKKEKKMEKSKTLLNQNKILNLKSKIRLNSDYNIKIINKNNFQNNKVNEIITLDNDKQCQTHNRKIPITKNIFSIYDYLKLKKEKVYKNNKTENKDLNISKLKENQNIIKKKNNIVELLLNNKDLKKMTIIKDDEIIDEPLLCNQTNFEVKKTAGDIEKKLLHLEFFIKKKFDELVKEIKIFIPIHFNSHTRDYNIIEI